MKMNMIPGGGPQFRAARPLSKGGYSGMECIEEVGALSPLLSRKYRTPNMPQVCWGTGIQWSGNAQHKESNGGDNGSENGGDFL